MYHAFVSDGRLFVRNEHGDTEEIVSSFAKEKMENAERQSAAHGWKAGQDGGNPFFGGNVVWGGQGAAGYTSNFRFKTVMAGGPDIIYYVLTNNTMTGLFKYNLSEGYESRLFHRNDFPASGIDYSSALQKFVAAAGHEDGSFGLELLSGEGQYEETLTSGDSRDCNPSFSRSSKSDILFQSAGIGRDEEGNPIAYSPESICRVNIETGEITELLSHENFDFLLPREDEQGNFYCIRRPHNRPGYGSVLRTIFYVVTFPVQFLIALVRFLDTFTKLFGAEPMKPAGPDVKPPVRNKHVSVLGQTIDLARIEKKSSLGGSPSLVPASWELLRFTRQGVCEVIATKVLSFDVDSSGTIHFTDGFHIRSRSQDRPELVLKHNIIEDVRIVAKA